MRTERSSNWFNRVADKVVYDWYLDRGVMTYNRLTRNGLVYPVLEFFRGNYPGISDKGRNRMHAAGVGAISGLGLYEAAAFSQIGETPGAVLIAGFAGIYAALSLRHRSTN